MCIHIYIYIYTHSVISLSLYIYIYIYIYHKVGAAGRARRGAREGVAHRPDGHLRAILSVCLVCVVCVYPYGHESRMHIYIYIYRERERERCMYQCTHEKGCPTVPTDTCQEFDNVFNILHMCIYIYIYMYTHTYILLLLFATGSCATTLVHHGIV